MRLFNMEILENRELAAGVFDMRAAAPKGFSAVPGQFVNIYLDRPDMPLPRPISICGLEGDTLRLVYQIAGKGTEYLSGLRRNGCLRAAGPLGNGFDAGLAENGKALLIGGGVGAPPLLFLAGTLKNAQVILGFRSASAVMLNNEFLSLGCETIIATDDGSVGYKGNAVEAAKAFSGGGVSAVYACGPRIMLEKSAEYAAESGVHCQISMEEHMGCGIGACLCCPAPVKDGARVIYKKLCKDGPVFDARAIAWEGFA